MLLKDIEVEGKSNFPCPEAWTVDQAEDKIRTTFQLAGGFLSENGVPLLSNALISSTTGALSFTSFTYDQGDFNHLFSSLLHSNSIPFIILSLEFPAMDLFCSASFP